MVHLRLQSCFMALGVLLIFAGAGIRADDSLVELADQAWAKRGNLEQAQASVRYLKDAVQKDPLREDLWVRLSLTCHWLGEITPESDKNMRLEAYEQGERAALQAIKVNPESIGGHFWAVVNNGRVTELKGLLSGSFNFGMCLKYMVEVAAHDPDYYYGGVYRYWGRFVYEIPSIGRKAVRFSLDDSIELLQKSLELEPNFFMTRLYLAESYMANNQRRKAYEELVRVMNQTPDVIPELIPENRFYQQKARELLAREFKGEPPMTP
jgi:tetratricopeptide (TPR) repeat protein